MHHLGRDRDLVQAQLVAIVERRRAAQAQEQHGRDPRLGLAHAAYDARPVVVAQNPVGPGALRQRRLVVPHDPVDRVGPPSRLQELEVEGQVRAREVLAVVGHQPFERQVDLPDQDAVRIGVHHPAHLGHHLLHFRPVGGVQL